MPSLFPVDPSLRAHAGNQVHEQSQSSEKAAKQGAPAAAHHHLQRIHPSVYDLIEQHHHFDAANLNTAERVLCSFTSGAFRHLYNLANSSQLKESFEKLPNEIRGGLTLEAAKKRVQKIREERAKRNLSAAEKELIEARQFLTRGPDYEATSQEKRRLEEAETNLTRLFIILRIQPK